MASGQPQMGFLFPCSGCEPLTQLTLKDMWYRSAEVKPGRTQVTLFPSQMEGLYIHTVTSVFQRKDDFFHLKNIYVSHRKHLRRRSCNVLLERRETRNHCWVLEKYPCYRNSPQLGFVFSWLTQGQDFQSLYFY